MTVTEKQRLNSQADVEKLAHYILNDDKILTENAPVSIEVNPDCVHDIRLGKAGKVELRYASGYLCTAKNFWEKCCGLEKLWLQLQGKKTPVGEKVVHIVLSWEHGARISDAQAHKIAQDLAHELGDYPAIIATHIRPVYGKDGNLHGVQKHAHLLVCTYPNNPVSMPHKLDFGRYMGRVRAIADRLAIANKQTIVAEPDYKRAHSYASAQKDKAGESWVRKLERDAKKAAKVSRNMGEFVKYLADKGHRVMDEGSYLMYATEYKQEKHCIKDERLGEAFTKDGLTARWAALDNWRRSSAKKIRDLVKESGKKIYVEIPVGGIESSYEPYRLSLENECKYYSVEALRSYFINGRDYKVYDETGLRCVTVDGYDLLRYLGVFPEHVDVQKLDYEDFPMLEKYLSRLKSTAKTTVEQKMKVKEIQAVRDDMYEHIKQPKPPEKKCGAIEAIILLLITILTQDDGLWNGVDRELYDEKGRRKEYVLHFGPEIDLFGIFREEEDDERITDAMIEIEDYREYWVPREIIEKVDEELERGQGLHYLVHKVFELENALNYFENAEMESEEEDRDIDRYLAMKTDLLGVWDKLQERGIHNTRELLEFCERQKGLEWLRPKLLQSASARFEYKKGLQLLAEYERGKTVLQRIPSLDDIVKKAEQKKEPAKKSNRSHGYGFDGR